MNEVAARFKELQDLVSQGERPEPRTEAQEDQMALEDMILLIEGAFALARYRRKWKQDRSLKLKELSPEDRAIIEREQANQKDFPDPPKGKVYAPRPKGQASESSKNSIPVAWMRDY
jgi:hypothetical protein